MAASIRGIAILAAAALSLCGPAAASKLADPSHLPPTNGDVLIVAQIASAQAAAKRGDYAGIVLSLQPAIRPAVLDTLSPARRREVLELDAVALLATGDRRGAVAATVRLVADGDASPADWVLAMQTAIAAQDAPAAWVALYHLIALDERGARGLSINDVGTLLDLSTALPDDAARRLALFTALERSGWGPDEFAGAASYIWLDFAVVLIDRGETEHAGRILSKIDDPFSIAYVLADRRFDVLVARSPHAMNVEAAKARLLEKLDADVRRHPASIAVLDQRIAWLAKADRSDQAMAVIDDITRRRLNFDDWREQQYGFFYWDGWLLRGAGRLNQAAVIEKNSTSNNYNPYYSLVRGKRLLGDGKAAEALAAVKAYGYDMGLSGDDTASLNLVRACAFAQLGDKANLVAELAVARRRVAIAPRTLIQALICAGDQNVLASTVIGLLADPKQRLAALGALQMMKTGLAHHPYRATLDARMATLRARPDVRKAVEGVGRINRYDLIMDVGGM